MGLRRRITTMTPAVTAMRTAMIAVHNCSAEPELSIANVADGRAVISGSCTSVVVVSAAGLVDVVVSVGALLLGLSISRICVSWSLPDASSGTSSRDVAGDALAGSTSKRGAG